MFIYSHHIFKKDLRWLPVKPNIFKRTTEIRLKAEGLCDEHKDLFN